MHADGIWLNELSGRVIGCAFNGSNTLGAGFLEQLYENALAHELRKAGLDVVQQRWLTVTYDGVVVGQYFVDLHRAVVRNRGGRRRPGTAADH
jgi:GxxExxY protein